MDAYEELMNSFEEERRSVLSALFESCHLTRSEKLEAAKAEADLLLFTLPPIEDVITIFHEGSKARHDEFMRKLRKHMHEIRYSESDYSAFKGEAAKRRKFTEEVKATSERKLTGRCPCPVDGEKTRCCNLVTFDAVTGCSFSCAYCSVQAFYTDGKIEVVNDFKSQLESELGENVWHIGTGQASDSLLLGDSHGTLTDLASFANEHHEVIIELKSKSGRSDWIDRKYPRNMIFTWSLNAKTIVEKEEHFTSSLEERIRAARMAADNGSLVGFHLHPMVYFKGWRDEYKETVSLLTSTFSPHEVCMVSFGTLTFTKSVIRLMRRQRHPSLVLSMPLVESAGKYTYTHEIKREMFSYAYSLFNEEWKKEVFFYLCMEEPSLWGEVLGREYGRDAEFEVDMKRHYREKVGIE